MEAEKKKKLPQEGTLSGESLPEKSGSPTYSGGGALCFRSSASHDLSDLVEVINVDHGEDTTAAMWAVAARKRVKKKTKAARTVKIKGHHEHSCQNRHASRETLQFGRESSRKYSRETCATATMQCKPTPSTLKEPLVKPNRQRRLNTCTEEAQEEIGTGSVERAISKRVRLDETQLPRGEAKRAKTRREPLVVDPNQSHLKVAVITTPPIDLSQAQADQIKEFIDNSILQTVLSSGAEAPSFCGRPFLLKGALAMCCDNEHTKGWLEKTIKKMASPVKGTTLSVIRQSAIQKKLKAGLLMHSHIFDPVTLRRALTAQNPWYDVDLWQCHNISVYDIVEEGNPREKIVHLVLGIPENQKPSILKRDRRVAHLSGSGQIRFFTSEEAETASSNPATTTTTSGPQQGMNEAELNSASIADGATSDDESDISCL